MRLPSLTALSEGLRATILRFPVPTLFAAIVTGLLIYLFDSNFDEEVIMHYVLLAGLGFVASLLCDLAAEARGSSRGTRLSTQAFVVVLLILYGQFIMPDSLKDPRPTFFYSYFILLFALHLGIALVPALAPDGSKKIWRFNLSCFLRYFFSSVNAALLFSGLALAMLSVDKLFELDLDDEFYPRLWVLCAFFAHPMLFLGGLPRILSLVDHGDFPKPLRFSLCFIGLPLVALYLTILYAYIAKIGIQWSWPNGWVAMPIFVLAVISLLTYVLSLPLPKSENWARLYHRWLFRLLLPLAIVLFMALQVRLSDYGMTINRYLGLALAIWLFGLSLAYILRPALKIGWMPFSLLIVSLFSIYAGPLGAFGWSERAQLERIRALATELGVMEKGVLIPTEAPQDAEVVEELQSALSYVLKNFGTESMEKELASFLSTRKNIQASYRNSSYYMTNKVMEYLQLNDELEMTSTQFYAARNVTSTYGHEWMIDYNFYNSRNRNAKRSYELGTDELVVEISEEANYLSVQSNGIEVIDIEMTTWAAEIKEAVKTNGNRNNEPLVWHVENKDYRFSFVCTNAQLAGENRFRSATFTVFLTLPEPISP
ncbi:hypothetical protein DDZ13_05345 [Coraliomargarita sinensis]|uniref:DUF4153 domain-containing protein n=1 Tax=Coraliomargarita sinensis TaxID=2174842 RepID=A0A317ZMH6_9BACT|nr:DUF4153 domain-containing protein [Coraliomargarita sinensis]PXA04601.1 hypothetical protein DDZ13_05345 [Coraliomargarita sinensis]